MSEEIINHGVLEGQRPEDWQAGSFTFISYEERNPSGDWRDYLPTAEKQFGKEDSMSCVSFSGTTCIEIQEKFLTGVENNYSDRFTAVMSGTTGEGNYLYKVGDSIRRDDGLVMESDYPTPSNYTFVQYHTPISEPLKSQLQAKGKQWLEKWSVRTEFVSATKLEMLKHLKHAPLQIVIPGHAVVSFLCEQDVTNYFDSYQPHQKQTPYSNLKAAYKYVLTPKNMPEKPKHVIINDGGKIYIVVLQGFAVGGGAAKSMEALAQLKSALEVPENAPTFMYPN